MTKNKKIILWFLIGLNSAGVVCFLYFAIPYFRHATQIPYPDVMLPAENWDLAGMALTVGLIPLFMANLLGALFVRGKRSWSRFLFFIPSGIDRLIVVHYWIRSLAK